MRKRTEDSVVEDDSLSSVVPVAKAQKKIGVPQPESISQTKTTLFSYESSGSQVSRVDQLATSTVQSETEHDRDATAIENRRKAEAQVLAGDDAEKAESVYRGLAGYKDWIEKRDQSGLSKGTGIRAGPIRAPSNLRMTVRFDYQPDLCKDYKETGTCGFGDSCKFMHDRGDYKTGWQMDREWDEQQKLKGAAKEEENYTVDPDEALPYACSICRQPFTNCIVTKCKHYFCEACALVSYKKSYKCNICGENTMGSFSTVSKVIKDKMEKRWADAVKRGVVGGEGEADAPEEDAEHADA